MIAKTYAVLEFTSLAVTEILGSVIALNELETL